MLDKETNALLTRVSAGTPMGALLRRYWQPALLSSELPERNGPPMRVRLLGEDLIAFRDTAGRIGLLGNHCSHRGASLFFGRNEECGLRCVYHGWKFDVDGNCVDMPNVSPENDFKHKIHHLAYPCVERGGVIWTYMGPAGTAPVLPDFEWVSLPESQRYITKHNQDCNWVQALEGDVDSSHNGFVHGFLDKRVPGLESAEGPARRYLAQSLQPKIEVELTDFGLYMGARRAVAGGNEYCRVTAFLMPFYTFIPPTGDAPLRANIWQPVDDFSTLVWRLDYHPMRNLTAAELDGLRSGLFAHVGVDGFSPPTSQGGGRWRAIADRSNDYLIDRDAQRNVSFSGLRGFWLQDRVVTESMGPIYDRSQEHLGTSDIGVIQLRRLLLEAADAVAAGTAPPGLDPASHNVRAVSMELAKGASWIDRARAAAVAECRAWQKSP
jgi:phthalate 4,5-dioxygenase oxygenase subunit